MKNGLIEIDTFYNDNNINLLDRNTLMSSGKKSNGIDILLNGFKGKVGELITNEDIKGEYCMLKNKGFEIDNIYLSLKNNLFNKKLYKIEFNSNDLSDYDKEMLKYLVDNFYVLPEMITSFYKEFFDNAINNIFDKINKINLLIKRGENLTRSYFDIDHDLFEQEKMILAHYMSRNILSKTNKKIIKDQFKKGKDDEDYFIFQFTNSYNLFKDSLNKTFNFVI